MDEGESVSLGRREGTRGTVTLEVLGKSLMKTWMEIYVGEKIHAKVAMCKRNFWVTVKSCIYWEQRFFAGVQVTKPEGSSWWKTMVLLEAVMLSQNINKE